MIAVLDLDGVVYDFVGAVLSWLKNTHKIEVLRSSLMRWDFFPTLTDDPRINIQAVGLLDDPGFFWNVPLLEGAQEAVWRMASHATLYAATARRVPVRRRTLLCLERDFPGVFSTPGRYDRLRCHFISSRCKAKFVAGLGADMFFDDLPSTVAQSSKRRVHTWHINPMNLPIPDIKRNRFLHGPFPSLASAVEDLFPTAT
jgi:hypothetical protein